MELVLYPEIQPTLEAVSIDKVIPMRYSRDKLRLPSGEEDRMHGYVTYFCNTSQDGIAKVLNNIHPRIINIGKPYKSYYYDYLPLYKFVNAPGVQNTGITRVIGKRDRVVYYTGIKERVEGIRTPITLEAAKGLNLIYDLDPYIRAFKNVKRLRKMSIVQRVSVFFKSMNQFMERPLRGYQGNTIFVDLDEYATKKSLNEYHFLTYLLLLLKRRAEFMVTFKSNYQIIFYTARGYIEFRMNEDLIRENYGKLSMMVKRLKPEIDPNTVVDYVEKEDISMKINIAAGFTGGIDSDEDDSDEEEELPVKPDSKIVDSVKKSIPDDEDDTDATVDTILSDADSDEKLKEELADVIIAKNKGSKTNASTKRDALLRERQKSVTIKGKTIQELTTDVNIKPLEKTEVKNPMIVNQNIKNVSYANFQKTYNDSLLSSDIADVLTMFNGKTIDMNVIKVDVEDTSNTLNLMETYTVVFEDEFRRRHTVKVNIPKFIDNKYLYINGGIKTIETQITALPVIKTDEDTVRINTNYNKLTIIRKGAKINPNMERFKKLIVDPDSKWVIRKGDNSEANRGELTCLEYDTMAAKYNSISRGNIHFVFNVAQLMEETDHKFTSTLDKILIGYKKTGSKIEPIYYDKKNPDHVDMISTMMLAAQPEYYDEFKKLSAGKKYVHTTTTIMRKEIPTVVLLCFFEGISTVVRKFNDPDVKFVDKKSNSDNYMYIRFVDGYLQYPMSNLEACILFNGLTSFTTANYTVSDLDNQQTYIDVLVEVCGDGYVAGALVNFYDFMIDPITLELLELLSLPTDLVSLIIYANNLLADNQYRSDINLNNYRLRNNEIVPAILYKQMAIAYARYRATARNSNPIKMSVDPNCVIKALQALPTVQDYPYLGPMTEIKMNYLASMKGYAGMNNDEAYKEDKRAYDESMVGVVGVSTDNAKNCGKERHLVLEPKVLNARGMLELTDPKDIDKLNDTQLETALEMLNPGGLLHDDPVRTAMATKQRGHAIPTAKQSPMLVTTGLDATIQYRTSNDYSVVAEEDGKVIDMDPKTKLMTIEYKSGKKRCIDLYPKMAKNGGAGFYLKNELATTFKKGNSFKKGDILAFDPYYYNNNEFFGNRLTFGCLVKTAIMSDSATYEDSDFFTKKLSRTMAAKITMCKRVTIGKNANVDFIVKPGDTVKVGDELIRFETSYNDSEMNQLLAGIRDDLHEAIVSLGKTRILAKYEGTIEDVICYPAVPVEEMSASLGKVVKNCLANDKARMNHLNKVDPSAKNSPYKAGVLMNRPTGVVEPDAYGKIDGEDVTDSVMFKFFITYLDELSDGDKITHQTANKSTLGDMIPEGFEPYSEFRPYEEISLLQPPSAILQRGTASIEPSMLHYKGLIELKRKQYEILTGESWNEKDRRENPYMDHTKRASQESILTEDQWQMLESLYDLRETTDGVLQTTRFYSKGDIILRGFAGINLESFGTKIAVHDSVNVEYDHIENCLIAKEAIYPGEILRMK